MNTITTQQKSVKDFIQLVLIDNIGHIVQSGNHYLGIGPQTQAIELIGAIIEDQNVEDQQTTPQSEFETQRKSRRRFFNALNLFSDPNYLKYCPELHTDPNYSQDYDLYKNLRCGYAHQMRPLGKIVITTELESYTDGTSHLEIHPNTNFLVIVSDFLFRDLKEVCIKVIQMIDNNQINHPKAYGNFLDITSFTK
jgi:hypothetical protein